MARVTVEDCLDNINNRFALVHLTSQRARQLLKGAKPTVEHSKNKAGVLALREIAAGNVYADQDLLDVLYESVGEEY
ncbi:DNA-directed RNA polymerase subunit omega [Myxococcota bacterium]|nr:DNA-directed RNA polymerase subunit omega [Myxococcota bacterium]